MHLSPTLLRPLAALGLAALCSNVLAQAPAFTADQAELGKGVYREHCQLCHGNNLSNGQFGTPLRGTYFRKQWAGKSLGELLQFTVTEMPPETKGSLPREDYAAAVAYILSRNDVAAGEVALTADATVLQAVLLPW